MISRKFLILLMVISFPVVGDTKASDTKVRFKKTEHHQFTGAKLEGKLKKPELSYIYERKGLRQEQIVNIPENFDDKIVEGAGEF